MATTQFLSNAALWREIRTRVAKARRTHAAIAYMGNEGADLLPLKKGDRLVVDMSLPAVKQGVTDPDEIRRLRKRGVEVFSRAFLHAKFIIADGALLVGSANISNNSRRVLDEAAILTTDPAAVRRARDLFDQLCTEPVRDRYLDECIDAYQPPEFGAVAPVGKRAKRTERPTEAKLWFIGGLVALSLSDEARAPIEEVEEQAEKRLKHPESTEVGWIRFAQRPKFLKHIRKGDWVVYCMKEGAHRYVYAPEQVLGEDTYTSPRGKRYHMLLLEAPQAGEAMPISQFRSRVRAIAPLLDSPSPRTRPVTDHDTADAILRLWTTTGRIAKPRRGKRT